MTVGENIQKYRKTLGLSQEELGQKLLVSRQTISLWEKDQTVPTIDNLIRIKDVFGVSVDEILGLERKESASEAVPKIEPDEAYRFNYTKEELNTIHRLQRKGLYKKPLTSALISVILFIFFIDTSAPDFMIGFVICLFILNLISLFKIIKAFNKVFRSSLGQICESTYEYRLFDDHIDISIYRNNGKVRESKCYYTDIEHIRQYEKWLLFSFGGQNYIVRKSDLKESSAFFSFMYKNPSKTTVESAAGNRWKIASVISVIASFLSLWAAVYLVGKATSANNLLVENTWLFFILTPIPIASVVLGFVLKSKGYKYRKNIVVGAIITFLLCIYGSFSFIFSGVYNHSDEPIVRAEQIIGIDIPDHTRINTQDLTKGTQSVSRGYIYSVSDVYFDDSVAKKYEKQLAADDKWLSSIPSDLIGITSPFSDYGVYDYNLIYNVDTSEFNALPQNSGTYRLINILYRSSGNYMRIVEYSIDYVK